jgi:capsule polysaccharide export protein KpsE/RkpR
MPDILRAQIDQGRLGEVILRGMSLFASGAEGNGQDLVDALATFRALGLEDTARQAALQLAILDAERARR